MVVSCSEKRVQLLATVHDKYKNSSGDETANANFYAVHTE